MHLVAVSVVKNEADVIEAFVRHTATLVDGHLIFDHASTDGTREILLALQQEGLPLSLFTDDALLNLQQHRSNHLARLAALEQAADWIVPLDADEFLSVPDRAVLEATLARNSAVPCALPLLDYCLSDADDSTEANPARRQQHAARSFSPTRKLVLPRALVLDPSLTISKGSHVITSAAGELPAATLPGEFFLAHLSQRSPVQLALRLITAELQRISRGQRHAGIDVHYRLGFQLLKENPSLFADITRRPAVALQHRPINYRGGPLRYAAPTEESRLARALLPFLESLAASHGRLIDGEAAAADVGDQPPIRVLAPTAAALSRAGTDNAFAGFSAASGWAAREGPIAAAFLPAFHWGMAPETILWIDAGSAASLLFEAEALTYSEQQVIDAVVDGVVVFRHTFARIYQKEMLRFTLPRPADGALTLRYAAHLPISQRDPRALAVIFLSLHISPARPA